MDFRMLAGPLIGAVIGYCTNYIAVKMLFRPLHPVKIGTWTLPFTPGIIPRGKSRLAKAIGEAVGKNLLTEESFSSSLLSPEIEEHLKAKTRQILYENRKNGESLKEFLLTYMEEPVYNAGFEYVRTTVTDKLTKKVLEMNIGDLIAEEVTKAIKERVSGGLLSLVVTDSLIDSFKEPVGDGINEYLDEHAGELIAPQIEAECAAAMETTVGRIATEIDDSGLPLDEIVWRAYESAVKKKLGSALRRIDISGMVENKISGMDVLEVETLVLSVMQKELNAVVNLGAVIGFLLGLINLFIR